MVYQILVMSLIIIEGLLIVISLKYLQKIIFTSKDFITAVDKAQEDILPVFKELKNLIEITSKKENHILHTVFYLEEIEMYVKMILSKLE
ncbi:MULTISPECIES: hypothetical protein [spotted fever group]|uniref:Uncharacterized protein n=1 Tax=Rickettsia tamurae subsp. buchneri TaxID=1462938 RepID=A0A8E1BZN7_9RICK|nr:MULTISPECIES: hypothetical protein [spotted fever group]EER22572.1 hypothetical protein REIS_1806 [Rickettsia endosymbiont of Ixodes scapularis]KDO02749.1 hypothetical protein REISMN_05270 [Rickettsia tamurae subsp. buchneri]